MCEDTVTEYCCGKTRTKQKPCNAFFDPIANQRHCMTIILNKIAARETKVCPDKCESCRKRIRYINGGSLPQTVSSMQYDTTARGTMIPGQPNRSIYNQPQEFSTQEPAELHSAAAAYQTTDLRYVANPHHRQFPHCDPLAPEPPYAQFQGPFTGQDQSVGPLSSAARQTCGGQSAVVLTAGQQYASQPQEHRIPGREYGEQGLAQSTLEDGTNFRGGILMEHPAIVLDNGRRRRENQRNYSKRKKAKSQAAQAQALKEFTERFRN